MTINNLVNKDIRDLTERKNISNKSSDLSPATENYKNDSSFEKIKEFTKDYSQTNYLDSSALEPKSIEFQESNDFIAKTKTGAKIYAHTDSKEDGTGKATNYLCGHVFRVGTEMKTEGLQYTGFIHIAKEPKENQYFDVLGTGIKGFADKIKDTNSLDIMITGFTQFPGVEDNPTGRFLFGDGVSTNLDSFGLKKPDTESIDKMMKDKFGSPSQPIQPYYHTDNSGNKIEAGRTYIYKDKETGKPRIINLTFVRLPVDKDFTNTVPSDNNPVGDGTGDILKRAIKDIKPDALISFGAGKNKTSEYNIETITYGMEPRGAVYENHDKFITNEDLVKIYREQLQK